MQNIFLRYNYSVPNSFIAIALDESILLVIISAGAITANNEYVQYMIKIHSSKIVDKPLKVINWHSYNYALA